MDEFFEKKWNTKRTTLSEWFWWIFYYLKKETPLCEISEQNVFSTRPKIEGNILNVMDKSTEEENLDQALQTKTKQNKLK